MPRAIVAVAVAAYAALIVSVATAPPGAGDWDWTPVVLLAAAHLGLGWAVPRAWVLLLPVALAAITFLAAGASGLDWLVLLVALPVLAGLTGLGLLVGRRSERREPVAIALVALALVSAASTVVRWVDRGPHVPASVQGELPTDVSLLNLCPGAESPGEFERDVRRRAEALIRELRRNPDHVVTYTSYDAHGSDERLDVTVRELAEEQLADLESGGPNCAPELERRLREAM